MLVQEFINQLTLNTDNVESLEYPDPLMYVNAAIKWWSFQLAKINPNELCVKITVTNGMPKPSNFICFVPKNGYPCTECGDYLYTNSGTDVANVKYAACKPSVSKLDDEIPFNDMYSPILIMATSMMINNRTPGISVAQEAELKSLFENSVAAAKGG